MVRALRKNTFPLSNFNKIASNLHIQIMKRHITFKKSVLETRADNCSLWLANKCIETRMKNRSKQRESADARHLIQSRKAIKDASISLSSLKWILKIYSVIIIPSKSLHYLHLRTTSGYFLII